MSASNSKSLIIVGSKGNDTIVGTAFRDFIFSLGGSDTISSGAGDDVIYTGSGNDVVYAGTGDDLVVSGSGEDLVIAGAGDDIVIAGSGNDSVYGGAGDDSIEAGSGDDVVFGGVGHDSILGQAGNDSLFGDGGMDVLSGDSGDDILSGGAGRNVILGGGGLDTGRYSGSIFDYTVTSTSYHGLWVFSDFSTDFDVLISVEKLRFDDYEVWVNGANNAVFASDDTAQVSEGGSVSTNVVLNDFDFDGDSFLVTSVSGLSNGASVSIINGDTLVFNSGSAYDYLNSGQSATEVLTYAVTDARGAVSTATLRIEVQGMSAAPHQVFFEDFERIDNSLLGNGWVVLRETEASDPNFHGSATVNIASGRAVFDYRDTDGDPTGETPFEQPYVYHDLAENVAETGFRLELDLTPGQSERIRQIFALTDSAQGAIESTFTQTPLYHPLLIPASGIGIEVSRSYSGNPNSSIVIWQFSGDTDFRYEDSAAEERVATFELQSFQFEADQEYHFSFSISAEGNLSLTVSGEGLTETFTAFVDNMPQSLDQLVCTSTEPGGQGIDQIYVDNLSVFSL